MYTSENTYCANSLRRTLDVIQLLKYELEEFKQLDIHNEIPSHKNLKADIAILLQAVNGFLFRLKSKVQPETFAALSRIIQRDQLKDMSLLMDVAYQIENLEDVTKALQMEIDALSKKEEKSPQ